jgi:hypothetical protein
MYLKVSYSKIESHNWFFFWIFTANLVSVNFPLFSTFTSIGFVKYLFHGNTKNNLSFNKECHSY